MKFFDLKNISERYLYLINPISPEKIITLGKMLRLNSDSRVIDFGCGFGEVLALWVEQFGISGEGIDIREFACQRARQRIASAGFADRIEISCADGASYSFARHDFDVAVCSGATFIWDGFAASIRAMREAIKINGRLAIGEVYWLTDQVPADFRLQQKEVNREIDLLAMAHQEGFDFEYVLRASHDDWDHYEAGNWYGLVRWIEENPDHPERQEVIDYLHQSQDEYLRYGRQYFGWAIYILSPMSYQTTPPKS